MKCDGRAHAPERRGQRASPREKSAEKARAARESYGESLLGSCRPLVLCAGLCGWALSSSCPPLVLVLAAPLNSVAGLCGPALCPGLVLLLSLSWPRP